MNNFVSVAQNLIDKGELKYRDDVTLQLSAFTPSCEDNALDAVEIRDIPPNITEDVLVMFLENTRRSGAGKVADIQYSERNRTALVTFEDQKGKYMHHIFYLYVIIFFLKSTHFLF